MSAPNDTAERRPLLSICMIAKNEELVIGRALASAAGLDAELVVVDTGSSDRTVEIATAAGARVFHFPWIDDFSAARNHALAQARGAWALMLDADEELTESLRQHLPSLLETTRATAFRVPATCLDDRGQVQTQSLLMRLVKNGLGYKYEGRVHEMIEGSAVAQGAVVATAPTEVMLLHHGYTSAETARKDRQTRNRKLLEASHAEDPENPRYWHYLGVQLHAEGEHARAAELLDRVLRKAPDFDLAAWSASTLAAILEAQRDFGLAWSTAALGVKGRGGRIDCLTQIGSLALREEDAATAAWCAGELERAPDDGMMARDASLVTALELRTGAQVLREPKSPKVRDQVLAAHRRLPRNVAIARRLVESCEAIEGFGKGTLDAVRRADRAPAVVGAAVDAYFRRGALDACLELGTKCGVRSERYAFALAAVGRADEARAELVAFGDGGAPFALVHALEHDDEVTFAHWRGTAMPRHALVFEALGAGTKIASADAWMLVECLGLAVTLRADRAAARLEAALGWSAARRTAFRALVAHDALDPMAGLRLALEQPGEPESLEVIGLVAHAHGDHAAASATLSLRAEAGDAPVRVYLKGADSLRRVGKRAAADALLAAGREARPCSHALAVPTGKRAAA